MKEIKQTKLFGAIVWLRLLLVLMECDIEDVPNVEVLMEINDQLWIKRSFNLVGV